MSMVATENVAQIDKMIVYILIANTKNSFNLFFQKVTCAL